MKTMKTIFKNIFKNNDFKQSVKYIIAYLVVFLIILAGAGDKYRTDVLNAGIVGTFLLVLTFASLMFVKGGESKKF